MADVTLVSTTATQDELNAALGITPVEPVEPPAVEQVADAGDTAGEGEKVEHKKKGGFQRKIDKLESALEASQRQNQELMDRLAGKAAEPPKPAPVAEGKPALASFQNYEDYVEALADWKVGQRLKSEKENSAKERLDAEAKETFDGFQAQLEKLSGEKEDFDEVMAAADKITLYQIAIDAIKELGNGAEVMYHLAKNPKLAEEMAKLKPLQQVAEIGKIALKLEKPSPQGKPRSAAPEPIKPVGGSSATGTGNLTTMAPRDYRRLRESGKL